MDSGRPAAATAGSASSSSSTATNSAEILCSNNNNNNVDDKSINSSPAQPGQLPAAAAVRPTSIVDGSPRRSTAASMSSTPSRSPTSPAASSSPPGAGASSPSSRSPSIPVQLQSPSRQAAVSLAGRAAGEDRQQQVWKEMHERMDRRRLEWNSQVDMMRKDFFRLTPAAGAADEGRRQQQPEALSVVAGAAEEGLTTGVKAPPLQRVNVSSSLQIVPTRTSLTDCRQQFQATFDLSGYELEEISVRTDGRRLIVSARHEQTSGQLRTSFSREFSRQVDIPRHVDPTTLRCTLSAEGLLRVDAVSTPSSVLTTSVSSPHHAKTHLLSPQQPGRFTVGTGGSDMDREREDRLTGIIGGGGVMPSGPIVTDQDGTRRFHIEVHIGTDFSPDELTVKTVDRKLYVEASHEEVGPGRRATSRELNREFELPDCVDPDTVTAHMTEDGFLVVEAPVAEANSSPVMVSSSNFPPPVDADADAEADDFAGVLV